MDRIQLADLNVSAQGLGCMGMSEYYGATNWDSSIDTLHQAVDLGVTLIDTADQYGAGHNEVLVGRGIADRRDKVQLATKFGIDRSGGDAQRTVRGDRNYVKRSAEASLLRLGVETIDLYYIQRPPQNAPIEETIAAMAELVAEGKVRHLGVSEFDSNQLRRAHAVHPITALQSEYSLWTRDVEEAVPTLRELGIGLVAYSPLGRGFLTGAVDTSTLDAKDFRSRNARFQGAAQQSNQTIADTVKAVAADLEATPAQVALAWVAGQTQRLGITVVPIPGTRRVQRLEENAAAADLHLNQDALNRLDALGAQVVGARY
jgi:aryl-alcohol dehydrogenase-like predicted oxidoreductase